MDFVAIDFEKLDDSQLSICEVGMVKFQNGEFVDEFHSFIRPKESLSRNMFGKSVLKRITNDMLLSAPTFSEIYNQMKEFTSGALLVCHKKGADLNYLYYNEKAYDLSGLYTEFIDTSDICKLSLNEAYQTLFGKPMGKHHYALDDAKHTAEILLALSKQTDVTQYVKKDYVPEKEKPKSDSTKYDNVSSDELVKEDSLLSDYDFTNKICVISGNSIYRDLLKSLLKEYGAKVTSSISGKTDAFVVGEDVGPTKLKDAKSQKSKRPDTFHIFTHEGAAKKLGVI